MKKAKILAVLMAGVLATSMLATGCSNTPSTSSGGSGDGQQQEETVNLKYYIMNGAVNDQDRIMEKANAIIEEEINANLELIMTDGNNYGSKINLMINSGDPWDLCFMGDWNGMRYYENAAEGAFADLTEKLPEMAPQSYKNVPEKIWNNMKVDGKIYGVFNYQQYGYSARKGFLVNANLADEQNFDWQSLAGKDPITVLKGLDSFIGQALEDHPDMIGWETSATSTMFNDPLLWDMENIGDVTTPGWIHYDDPTTVINQYATDEFKQYCEVMRDWYNKGYVKKDGATISDTTNDRKAGKFVAAVSYDWPDSIEAPQIKRHMSMCTVEDFPAYVFSTTRTMLPAGVNAATCISADTPNVDKSLELIELLNTNDELYNLISYGEEGVDYTWDDNGGIKQIEGKYNFNWSEYQIGQSYSADFTRALYEKNENGDMVKEGQKLIHDIDANEATASPITGFVFNTDPVKTEIAACSSIITEMVPALAAGSVDPAEKLPEFLDRLEQAGVNKIIEEKQKQLDEFNASK